MAAKRKYMETELPPQESEGKSIKFTIFDLRTLNRSMIINAGHGSLSLTEISQDQTFSNFTFFIQLIIYSASLFRPLPGFKPASGDMAHRR